MSPIRVAVAVIKNTNGKILIAKRKLDCHMGGKWEFPGGKVQVGETVLQALRRELSEELDIAAKCIRPLVKIFYAYPDKMVLLDVHWVDEFEGQAKGNEGQVIQWCTLDALSELDFPDANIAIINAIKLPDYYFITPDLPPENDERYLQWLGNALQAGAKLIQLRCPQYSEAAYINLADKAYHLCCSKNVLLTLNARLEVLNYVRADGIHLNRHRLFEYAERPLACDKWLSVSCHSEHEMLQANRIGADFISLSPVQKTVSHKAAEALGWEQFKRLCAGSSLPVYALGGMRFEDLAQAQDCGARGIAGIRLYQQTQD